MVSGHYCLAVACEIFVKKKEVKILFYYSGKSRRVCNALRDVVVWPVSETHEPTRARGFSTTPWGLDNIKAVVKVEKLLNFVLPAFSRKRKGCLNSWPQKIGPEVASSRSLVVNTQLFFLAENWKEQGISNCFFLEVFSRYSKNFLNSRNIQFKFQRSKNTKALFLLHFGC